MKTTILQFYGVKLLILVLTNICLIVLSLLINGVIGTFAIEALTEEQNVLLTEGVASGICMLGFIALTIIITIRMKKPEHEHPHPEHIKNTNNIIKFSLKETSVYAIYLVPVLISTMLIGVSNLSSSVLKHIYAPHISFIFFGLSPILDCLIMLFIYFAVTFITYAACIKIKPNQNNSVINNKKEGL